MALQGPIILIEDDQNDIETIEEAIREVGVKSKVIPFVRADDAITYLLTTKDQPFFILCDIKLPVLDGLSFRDRIMKSEYLKRKAIPFIFFTGFVSQEIVNAAYEMDVQGFYQKESSFQGLKEQLLTICMYWKYCLHPNSEFTNQR